MIRLLVGLLLGLIFLAWIKHPILAAACVFVALTLFYPRAKPNASDP
jgi:4-hydroxybenzoate polyprenyltransferase